MQFQRVEEQVQDQELFCKALKSGYISSPWHNIKSGLVIPIALFSVAVRFSWWGLVALCVISPFSSDILFVFPLCTMLDLPILCSWCIWYCFTSLLVQVASGSGLCALHLPCPCSWPWHVAPFRSWASFWATWLWGLSWPWTEPSWFWQSFIIVLGACFIFHFHFNHETTLASMKE